VPQSDLLQRVDHLVYATPDLERTVDELDHFLSVRAAPAASIADAEPATR